MLQLQETRIARSKHEAVLPGVIIPEEGMALVYVKDGEETKVKPSTGSGSEVFAGVSWSRAVPPAAAPFVQEGVVSTGLRMELPRAPISGQLNVKVNGTQKTIVSGAPASAAEVQVSGRFLIFYTGEAAKAVKAQFLYAPNVVEARAMLGDGPHGGLSSSQESIIGTLKDAQIATNFFDASADWSTTLYAKLGAGGIFVPSNLADSIPNVVVKKAPNGSNPFLVLSLNVA